MDHEALIFHSDDDVIQKQLGHLFVKIQIHRLLLMRSQPTHLDHQCRLIWSIDGLGFLVHLHTGWININIIKEKRTVLVQGLLCIVLHFLYYGNTVMEVSWSYLEFSQPPETKCKKSIYDTVLGCT